MPDSIVLVGYSGHGYVACDIFTSINISIKGYVEPIEKENNPFNLTYLGSETDQSTVDSLSEHIAFIAVGENIIRRKLYEHLIKNKCVITNAIHKSSDISTKVSLGKGVMVGPKAVINALTIIEDGVICNTGSIIEHECYIGKFSHIAPGAILCGNVKIGENTLVGAGSVVRPNITIGKNVIIGAGAVIVKNIPDGSKVIGGPLKFLL